MTRVTFYRHFPSKDHLIAAYLEVGCNVTRSSSRRCGRQHAERPGGGPRPASSRHCRPRRRHPGSGGAPTRTSPPSTATPTTPAAASPPSTGPGSSREVRSLLDDLGVERADVVAEQLVMLRAGAMAVSSVGSSQHVADAFIDAWQTLIDRHEHAVSDAKHHPRPHRTCFPSRTATDHEAVRPNASRPSAAQPVGSSGSGCSNSQGPSNALTSAPVCRVAASRKSSVVTEPPAWSATHLAQQREEGLVADLGAQRVQVPVLPACRPGRRTSGRARGRRGRGPGRGRRAAPSARSACAGRRDSWPDCLRPQPLAVAGEPFVQPDVAASARAVTALPNHWWASSWAISRVALPVAAHVVAPERRQGLGLQRDLEVVVGHDHGVAGERVGAEQPG